MLEVLDIERSPASARDDATGGQRSGDRDQPSAAHRREGLNPKVHFPLSVVRRLYCRQAVGSANKHE